MVNIYLLLGSVLFHLHSLLHRSTLGTKVTIQLMLLLLNRTAKLHQLLGNSLPSLLHNLLKLTSMALIPRLKERVGYTILPCTAGAANSMNIILTVWEAMSVSLVH